MTHLIECPVCGAHTFTQDSQLSTLLAVCDVLVLKALEGMGKWIVRHERSRYSEWAGKPYHLAHTQWQVDDEIVCKALRGAWDVVPAMMGGRGWGVGSDAVTAMLDEYVHDLVITGTPHRLEELLYRFESRLGLPVYLHGAVREGAVGEYSLAP